jgi:putative aldouronate transport system substrate-binding protein
MSNNDVRTGGGAGRLSRRSFVTGAAGLATAAAGGLLSGCTESSGSEAAGNTASSLGPKPTLGPQKTGVVYPAGYKGPIARDMKPFTTEKVTFTVVVPQDLGVGDWQNNTFSKWLEQRTGVHIEYKQVAGGDDMMTKVNAMIAAGDIPDAFLNVEFTRAQLSLYGQQGLFQSIDGLIDSYAPNLVKAMQEYPDARKLIQSPDKKIYSFPDFNDCYHCRAFESRSWINSEWIKRVGLAMPKTTDEFRELLRAFKKADIGGNGRTVPFAGYKDEPIGTFFMNAFLYSPPEPWLVVDDGKAAAAYTKDEWREGLKYINSLYTEGLLNKDIFTATGEQMGRLGNAKPNPLIGGARSGSWGGFVEIDQKDPNARWRQYVALEPLQGPNGVRYSAWDYYGIGVEVGTLVITKKCTRPELLVQWADAQMDLESILRCYSGPNFQYAKAGEKGINGKQAIYANGQAPANDEHPGWSGAQQYGTMYRSNDFRLAERVNPNDLTFEAPLFEETEKKYFPHKQPQEMSFPPVTLTEDQAAQEAELTTNLTTEVGASFAKFVTGQYDPNDDGQWKDYLNRIDQIGLKSYLELQQAGYEAYDG